MRRQEDPPSRHDRADDQRLPLLAVVAVAGSVAGWLVVQASPGSSISVIAFRRQPWYTVWSSLGALFVALWLILGLVAMRQVWSFSLEEEQDRWNRVKLILRPALGYLIYAILVAYLASALSGWAQGGNPGIPLSHPLIRVDFFAGVAAAGSLPSAVGLWITRRRAGSLSSAALRPQTELLISLDQFLVFQSRNQRFLAALSTIIATAVLQTSALRNALIGAGVAKETGYPPEFVLLYGAIFAVAVAIVYLPSELALREAGRTLQRLAVTRMEVSSASNIGIEHWLERVDQQDRIGKALGLDVPILARVQTSLGLLAPLIAALVGALVPH